MNAVLDSNILIDSLKGIPQAELELSLYSSLTISIITWMEVMAGAKPRDEALTRDYLESFSCLGVSQQIADLAYVLRRDRKLKLPDAIILATAQNLGVLLVTRNTRDFAVNYPQIRIPYQI